MANSETVKTVKTEKSTNKAEMGHANKAGTSVKKKVFESSSTKKKELIAIVSRIESFTLCVCVNDAGPSSQKRRVGSIRIDVDKSSGLAAAPAVHPSAARRRFHLGRRRRRRRRRPILLDDFYWPGPTRHLFQFVFARTLLNPTLPNLT